MTRLPLLSPPCGGGWGVRETFDDLELGSKLGVLFARIW